MKKFTPLSFTATLDEALDEILLEISKRMTVIFTPSDFEISHGVITKIDNFADSVKRKLYVSGIPSNTNVTVTYVGAPVPLPPPDDEYQLERGTKAIAKGGHRSDAAPSITPISDVTLNAGQTHVVNVNSRDRDGDSINLILQSAPSFVMITDHKNGSGTVTLNPSASDVGTHVVIIKATANGKTDTESFSVQVIQTPTDIISPTITAPADIITEATGLTTIVALGNATASDNIDPSPKVTNNAPLSFPLGATVITWTATDQIGNKATDTQTVTVRDTTAPMLSNTPSDIVARVASNIDTYQATFTAPTATDLVDDTVAVAASHASGSAFPIGNTTVSFTATDKSGNAVRHTITITIIQERPSDTTPPTIMAPADVTVEATGPLTTVPLGSPVASDDMDPNPAVANDAPVSFGVGATIITWTATDETGNKATDTQTVSVRDTTAPEFAGLPSDVVARVAWNVDTYNVTFAVPTAIDIVDGTVAVVASHGSGYAFPVGNTTVSFTATDKAGNAVRHAITITIIQDPPPDTTPPTITAPVNIVLEATAKLTVLSSLGTPVVSDDMDSDPHITNDAHSAFPVGVTIITWTATDDAGNSANDTQTVTIRDTTPPVLSDIPSNISTTTTSASGARVTFTIPTATDVVDGTVTVKSSHASGSLFSRGPTTITFTATDAAGNTAAHYMSVFVIVIDVKAPNVVAPPDITAEATGVTTVVDLGIPAVSDNQDPSPRISNDAPDAFLIGTTIITWSATDASKNTGTDTQTVTIRDTTPPAIVAPPDMVVEATGRITQIDLDAGAIIATDLVDDNPTITHNNDGTGFGLGTTIILWSATDRYGNSADVPQKIIVQDTTPPEIRTPRDIFEEATGVTTVLNLSTPRVSDLVDPYPVITSDAPDAFTLGVSVVNWTATDKTGNSANATQRITISDTTPPVFAVAPPPPELVVNSAHQNGTIIHFDIPLAIDAVDGEISVKVSHESGSVFPIGQTYVIFTLEDSSGNYANYGTIITVRWVPNPEITAPPDITTEATGPATIINLGVPQVVADPFDPTPVITNDAPDSFPVGTTTVTWNATSSFGGAASAIQTVTIRDTTPPSLTELPADITRGTTFANGTDVSFVIPIATDVVDGAIQVTSTHAPGSIFALGTHNVTFYAEDMAGNRASHMITITVNPVEDETAPVIAPHPAEITFEATARNTPLVLTPPIVTDNWDPDPLITHDGPDTFPLGTTTITWTISDEAGNTVTTTQNVTLQDTTPPEFHLPVRHIVKTIPSGNGSMVEFEEPIAVDSVHGWIPHQKFGKLDDFFPLGVSHVVYYARDPLGNSQYVDVSVTVKLESQPDEPLQSLNETFDKPADSSDSHLGYIYKWRTSSSDPDDNSSHDPEKLAIHQTGLSTLGNSTHYMMHLATDTTQKNPAWEADAYLLFDSVNATAHNFEFGSMGQNLHSYNTSSRDGAAIYYAILYNTDLGNKLVITKIHSLNPWGVVIHIPDILDRPFTEQPEHIILDALTPADKWVNHTGSARDLYNAHNLGDYDRDVNYWHLILGGAAFTEDETKPVSFEALFDNVRIWADDNSSMNP